MSFARKMKRSACNDCRYNFENMEKWKEVPDEVADDKHL